MVNDSPASILYDNQGNPIGIIRDGIVYRLQVEAKLTDGSSVIGKVQITDGYNSAQITDILGNKALKVDVIKTVASSGTSSNFNDPFPISGTASGFIDDGYLMQAARVFDLNTSDNIENVLGVSLRKSNSDGSVELGTITDPIRIDPIGTTIQPISGTVTANAGTGTFTVSGTVTSNIGTTNGLALDATLTGGTATTRLTDGTNTATVKAASTAAAATDKALVVAVSPNNTVGVTGTFWQATQPVSGTITANIGTAGTLALDTTLAKLTIAQSTALGSNTQAMVGGSVTTAAPTYTTGNINPLSLTTTGLLRVDGSGITQPVSGTFWQATQPVSGTVTANAGTGTFAVSGTVTSNIGTTNGLALDATLTGGTQRSKITDGTTNAAVKAASTAAAATDPALVVAISPNNTIPVSGTFWQATQPVSGSVTVSGTVTSNQGTANTAANGWFTRLTDGTTNVAVKAASTAAVATDPALVVAISPNNSFTVAGSSSDNTANSTSKTPTIPARANTSAPTWTDGNMVPLSVDTSGALRITGSISASNPSVSTTGSTTPASATLTGGTVTTAAPTYTTGNLGALSLTTGGLLRVDGSGVTQPVSGTFWQATQPVSGTITANIGTVGTLALDATVAKLTVAQSTALGSNTQTLVGGSVTTAAPTYTTGNINPLSLTTAGAVRTDSSGTTQPISGTVTANAGSGTFAVSNTVLSVVGGGTEATAQRVTIASDSTGVLSVDDNSGSLTVDNTTLSVVGGGAEASALRVTIASDSTGVLSIDDNGSSVTIDSAQLPATLVGARLDTNIGAWLGSTVPTVGQKTMAESIPIALASDQTSIPITITGLPSTGTITTVASSAVTITILASNSNRKGATIYNNSTKKLYLKFGTTVSTSSFTTVLESNAYYEVPFGYTGIIDGVWQSANGNALITELT